MSKSLIVVESPAKARTIEKFLGKRYLVKASLGHVRDLPRSQMGVDVEHGFTPKYITIRGKGEVIKELREAAKKANKVYLAADPDREGEAICWHLAYLLGIEQNTLCRIEFNEITKTAVQEAIKKPRKINLCQVNAQQARRILDRLVGYKLSPLLWRKIRSGLSAGRVQSVAVRLICDREDEINNFIPEEYWSVVAKLSETEEAPTFLAKLVQKGEEKIVLPDRASVEAVLGELEGVQYIVESVKRRERRRNPAPPFTTSSLQQEASRKLGFTTKKTMLLAQQLYEGIELGAKETVGVITYMRTDSTRVAEVAQKEVRNYIMQKYGQNYLPAVAKQHEVKENIQDAHEAIRPTNVYYEPGSLKQYLTKDQYKLYKLIWERFVASQMSAAVLDTLTIDVKAGNYLFRATGSTIKFAGFMVIYIESRDDEEIDEGGLLPNLRENQVLYLHTLTPEQHFTQPPPRYTEASLVKALEENGIGRPSTYVPIIATIQQRGYVKIINKRFEPTELGCLVVELLKEYFPDIVDVEFTAEMEDKLDQIASGKADWVKILEEFYQPFARTLAKADEQLGEITLQDEITEEKCERCGRNMVIKYGRYGKFLACPGYPECRNTKPIVHEIGVKCPICQGEVVERRTKKGRIFYGCSNFPECTFTTWNQPVKKECPQCGAFLIKQKGRKKGLKCVREGCNYHEGE